MTNFPLSSSAWQTPGSQEPGLDRYDTCCWILDLPGEMSVERGEAVLQATVQVDGDFPTQLSMLAVPQDYRVYFYPQCNFDRCLVFSFVDGVLRTHSGYESPHQVRLDARGVLLSTLAGWS